MHVAPGAGGGVSVGVCVCVRMCVCVFYREECVMAELLMYYFWSWKMLGGVV